MHKYKINPKRRDNFIPFFFSKGKYIIDDSINTFDCPKDLMMNEEFLQYLKRLPEADINTIKELLSMIEKNYKDYDSEILFPFLYSSHLFVSMLKKNILDEYENIVRNYNEKLEKYENVIKQYYNLKTKKQDTGTLKKATEQISGKSVVTRFPPEPSGYLHLGHAKAALLNNFFVEKNNGTLIVRFDDTNPIKEEQHFVDVITDDLKNLLGLKNFELTYTSNYFDEMIEYAVKLIKKGKAYVDDTDVDKMREERMNGIESKCRNYSIEENITIFEKMINGKCNNYCLRAKIDMFNVNKALRDPVIYRCVDKAHHRVGKKYKIYPTYDFACPIVDSIENITTVLRTNEYRDRNEQYNWFIRVLEMKNKPKIKDFARLSFENTILSKRKLKNIVDTHKISWEDPRMPTLRGIKRLGMLFDVLKEYILLQGVGQKNCKVSWDKIWAMNKKRLENIAEKYFGIEKKKSIVVKIIDFDQLGTKINTEKMIEIVNNKQHTPEQINSDKSGIDIPSKIIEKNKNEDSETDLEPECIENLNLSESFIIKIPKNKKNLDLGSRNVSLSKYLYLPDENYENGEEITLMQLGNFIIHKRDNLYTLKFVPNGDFKKTRFKVQWVSKDVNIMCSMIEYGDLCKNEEGDFNEDSRTEQTFICEKNISNIKPGSVFQLERIAFYYKEKEQCNLVPFTKQLRKK